MLTGRLTKGVDGRRRPCLTYSLCESFVIFAALHSMPICLTLTQGTTRFKVTHSVEQSQRQVHESYREESNCI